MTEKDIFTFEPASHYLPPEKPPVFGVVGLAHPHIFGMCEGLCRAGAILKYVCESDTALLSDFLKKYPAAIPAEEKRILSDEDVKLVVSAAIPALRAGIAIRAMTAGRDVFVDKAPVISLSQLEEVKRTIAATDRRYFVYYSESVTDETAVYAGQLIRKGVIGKVVHVDGCAPHRLKPATRATWFFDRRFTGGILTDLVCHQIHQFLCWSGADNATAEYARTRNYCHPQYDDFDDFGDVLLTANNGATGYFRVDWNVPEEPGSRADPRMIIQGETGYIELRKNCNIGSDPRGGHVFVVNGHGQFYQNISGKVVIPFFGNLINDCLYRTETAVPSDIALKSIELAIRAQNSAAGK